MIIFRILLEKAADSWLWSPEEMYFWGALKWTHTMRLSGLWEKGEYNVIQWQHNKIWCDTMENFKYIN